MAVNSLSSKQQQTVYILLLYKYNRTLDLWLAERLYCKINCSTTINRSDKKFCLDIQKMESNQNTVHLKKSCWCMFCHYRWHSWQLKWWEHIQSKARHGSEPHRTHCSWPWHCSRAGIKNLFSNASSLILTGQILNIFIFKGHMVSVSTTQLCPWSSKTSRTMEVNEWSCFHDTLFIMTGDRLGLTLVL
jgi:hypothetical protein